MSGLVAILALVVAVYAQTLAFPFHFDDRAILADPVLASPHGWWRVFRLEQTRPLTYLTFWLNYRLGQDHPAGYHALNVFLHSGAAAAAFAAFRRLVSPAAALAAAAVFALHPLQTEGVCYVFARASILAALFCLLSWRAWLAGRPWWALGSFCLALAAKEEAVSFPIFLLLTSGRREWRPLAAMLAASVAAGVRLFWVAAHTPGSGLTPRPSLDYLSLQAVAVAKYLQLFLLPIGQNFDHHIQRSSTLAVVVILGLIGVAVWRRGDGGLWVLGALVLLAPSSSLIPLADLAAEHRMYLPLAGLSVAAGLAVARLPKAAAAALVAALAVLTFARARVWSSERALWADAEAKSPAKFRPKVQLARTYFASDPERAESLLLEARKLEPRHPESYTQMGTLMLEQRNPYGALGEFEEALRLAPSADTHSNRGTALYLLGRAGEAAMEFRDALRLNPCHANARHNLGLLARDLPPVPSSCPP